MDSKLAIPAVAGLAFKAEHSTPTAMSDRNPKEKRKLQAQHDLHKKQKAEEMQREHQRLQEIHLQKHPHESKG